MKSLKCPESWNICYSPLGAQLAVFYLFVNYYYYYVNDKDLSNKIFESRK